MLLINISILALLAAFVMVIVSGSQLVAVFNSPQQLTKKVVAIGTSNKKGVLRHAIKLGGDAFTSIGAVRTNACITC